MFLPPNVDNDQSGLNPILAALSGNTSPSPAAPAPVPGAAAATPAPSGGGFLASLFGGGAGGAMGNPIGNALVNSGGHLLLPLLGSLLGGRTPQQQELGARQAALTAAGTAEAQGFAGLDDALQEAKGNQNRAIHIWMQTPAGHDFFVHNGKMADVKTYLETASPDGGMTADQKNFEYMLKNSGVTGDNARQLAAKNKLGLLKVVPRTTTNAEGVTVPTGDYDVVDITNGSATKLQGGGQGQTASTPSATSVPNVASAEGGTQQSSGVKGPVVPFGAEIAESVGPVGGTVASGGSLLSNAVPGAYPAITQQHRKQVDQIEADAADLMNTFKRGGRGDVVKPLQDLSQISKAGSPQEAVTMMMNARQWMQDQITRKQAIVNDPRMANTDEGKNSLTQLYALQGAISHLPPMQTQTLSDGTKIIGLQEEAAKLAGAANTGSPLGQYLGDIPSGLERIWNAGKDYAGAASGEAPKAEPKAAPAKTEQPKPVEFADEKAVLDAFNNGKIKPDSWVTFKDSKGNTVTKHIRADAHGKY